MLQATALGFPNTMRDETSNTWLHSLKKDRQATEWRQFVDSYGPFIRGMLVKKGLRSDTADDVVQNVLTVVVARLPDFERQRTGSFRSWLRSITVNCLRDYWKSNKHQIRDNDQEIQDLLKNMEDPHSEFTLIWNREHARHVLDRLLEKIAGEFAPRSIEVFKRLAIDDHKVDDVARELKMSVNACFIARSRVLRRLRKVLRELFGEDEVLFELIGR